jgi:hypothetical protein
MATLEALHFDNGASLLPRAFFFVHQVVSTLWALPPLASHRQGASFSPRTFFLVHHSHQETYGWVTVVTHCGSRPDPHVFFFFLFSFFFFKKKKHKKLGIFWSF